MMDEEVRKTLIKLFNCNKIYIESMQANLEALEENKILIPQLKQMLVRSKEDYNITMYILNYLSKCNEQLN
ncbi:hypothetical protein [uncultured Chryseobacterium sp.]|uniref:hypothetical protein n=1 Tax=uncultured Chryseobacterium sp. TaxID=259322 RepID=UPI002587A224|nr:hypothetical protein [uncultured Chryseobacterium sp.]